MSDDLISNNFVENVNRSIIKRNLRLVSITFILTIIYTIFIAFNLYLDIVNANFENLGKEEFIYFIIDSAVVIGLSLINVIGYSIAIKANKLIKTSFENADAESFNKGYALFLKASYLGIVSFSIAALYIASQIVNHFIKYEHLKLY